MEPGVLVLDVVMVAVLGAAINLDRKSAFQIMVSQPLVLVPLMGLVFDSLQTALHVGIILQLLWMSSLLVGASVPPNETIAAAVIGGIVLLYERHVATPLPNAGPDVAMQGLAILIGAPFAQLGRHLDIRLERGHLALAHRADEAARAGEPKALSRLPLLAIMRTFVAGILIIAAGLTVGLALLAGTRPNLTPPIETTLIVIRLYLIPALGVAVALSAVRRSRAVALAAVSLAVGSVGLHFVELG